MKKHYRILIIGNSGSGKTWLGHTLSKQANIALFHMDEIRWKEGEFLTRRSAADIEKDLDAIKMQDQWILEGVFGKMAKKCVLYANMLIWLDLPWDACKKNLLNRGPQFEDCLPSSERDAALEKLVDWASEHWVRKDYTSWVFFNDLYNNFERDKIHLNNQEEVMEFFEKTLG